jgi:hypothetical protein
MPLARCFLPMCMRCALLHRQGCVSFGTVCLSSMQSAAHITQVLLSRFPGLAFCTFVLLGMRPQGVRLFLS